MKKFIVITTINPKSEGIADFSKLKGWQIILVGDRKSHTIENTENITFLSVEDQQKLGFDFVEACPYDRYARKNIGYLYALQQGAEIIYDTDDDNLPYECWSYPDFVCDRQITCDRQFANIYQHFSEEFIWPRGFPLDEIHQDNPLKLEEQAKLKIGVWQGLADIEPDVDAIFRLVINRTLEFESKAPVAIEQGTYCPFNSQNTWWTKAAFPYLYLPAKVSFRFTDILRGYIAQRLLWEAGMNLGFTEATVYQERNPHDLMRDFRDEIECYTLIKSIVEVLDSLDLMTDPLMNLQAVYRALVQQEFVPEEELTVLEGWIADCQAIADSRDNSH